MGVVGSWGNISWQSHELLKVSSTVGSNWVEIPLLTGLPALQKVGEIRQKFQIKLRGTRELLDGFTARLNDSSILVTDGSNQGRYVIDSLRWESIKVGTNGYPTVVDIELEFGRSDA